MNRVLKLTVLPWILNGRGGGRLQFINVDYSHFRSKGYVPVRFDLFFCEKAVANASFIRFLMYFVLLLFESWLANT